MSTVTEIAAPVSVLTEHRPWWRSRLVLSTAIVGAMLVCFFAWRTEFPWPSWLEWNSLSGYLDDFQTWLIDQRNAPDPNVGFSILNGVSSFLDDLVTWLTHLLLWMTWIGTTVVSVLIVLRFGGWRAGLIVLGAFASFAAMGLWEESIQTIALMLAAVALSLLVGMPLGVLAGRSKRFERTITPALDAM
jgi:glycine betaine/proline transport system permease protein